MQQNAFDAALGRLSSLLGGGDEPEAAPQANAMATAAPQKEVAFRASMLPIGNYDDGSIAFPVWPQGAVDVYEAMGRFHRGEPPLPQDGLVLGGLAMTGGAFGGLARSGGNAMVRAAANPKEAAPAGALAMDAASRAGRARAMGFDPDRVFYHGSQAGDIEAFDLGRAQTGWRGKAVHVSEDPDQAAMYGADGRDYPGAVYPLNLRLNNTADFQTIRIPRSTLSSDDLAKVEADWGHLIGDGDIPAEFVTLAAGPDAMAGALQKLGYDSFRDGPHVAVFDPKNIRSKFAAFDPAQSDSADLLAANPPGAAGAGAVVASSNTEHHSRSQPRGEGGRFVGRDSFDGRLAALDKMMIDLDGDGRPDVAIDVPRPTNAMARMAAKMPDANYFKQPSQPKVDVYEALRRERINHPPVYSVVPPAGGWNYPGTSNEVILKQSDADRGIDLSVPSYFPNILP